MTTDITELAQSEINDALAQLKQISEYPTPSTQYARVLRKYILALVEALEKAQQQMTESENRVRKQNRHICELFDDNTALRQRIAELEEAEQQLCAANVTLDARAELAERQLAEMESRTVKLPKRKNLDPYSYDQSSNCKALGYNEALVACRINLDVAGIKVEAE